MDKVVIETLQIDTVIGVFDFEQRYSQRLLLDLELGWDIRPAAAGDELGLTLDYAAVCERLREYAQQHPVSLVETLVEQFAQLLHREFSVSWARLHLRKPSALAFAGAVGVCIERNYNSAAI